ncbi:MAG TPA: HAD-IC family P-type ATPase, partial [Micromonosporaceae bacterium]
MTETVNVGGSGTSSTVETATEPDLAKLPLDELEKELATGSRGLSSADAARRLELDGPNEVAGEERSALRTLLGYFWAPIPWMIEVALVLSVIAAHWLDAAVIGVLLVMNGAVAFVEEHQAASAVAALRGRLAAIARARRDGVWTDVAARELVVGDVIHLAIGDVVPADARLVDGTAVQLDESALTGESLPVTRDVGDVLYSGAVVTRGTGDALVYATGSNSFFGRTTALVEKAGTVSHFQRAVLKIGRYLIVLAVTLVAVTAVVSLARGDPTLDTLQFALVVTIASVPVALPAVLSVTMAVGTRQLARRQAVVSHLPAVEELGGIDVLCTDKTGTLTQNRLAIAEPWPVPEGDANALVEAAILASREEDGGAIDLAIIAAGRERGVSPRGQVSKFTPFDPVAKRSMADVQLPG